MLKICRELLFHHRGIGQVWHPLSKERKRRLRRQESPPYRHLRSTNAEWRYRQESPLSAAATRTFADFQSLHGNPIVDGKSGRIAGAIGVNTRTGEFLVVKAKAVILCMGAAGRLGLPTSGYMFGTYENAANSGDGYAMAYHAGAKLANLECFQINPLIKDYNGPACAYVAGPFGAYTTNNQGERFIECDYWSGR